MLSAININDKKIYLPILIFGAAISALSLFMDFYIIFLSVATFVTILAIFTKPLFGFYLLLITLIVEHVQLLVMEQPFAETKFYLHLIFLYPTCLSWFMARSAGLIGKRPYNSLDTLVIAVVIYQTLSILWAPSLKVSLLTSIILYSNCLLYFMPGALVRNQKVLKNCITLWIITGAIVGAGVLLTNDDFINIGGMTPINKDIGFMCAFKWQNHRASGFAGADHAAGFLVLASSFTIGAMIMAKQRRKKLMYLVLVIFMFYCIIVSATRASMFGGIVLFPMFLSIDPFYRKKLIKYSFITVGVAFLVILLAEPGMIDRTLIGFRLIDSPVFFEKKIIREATLEQVSGIGIRIVWWKEGLRIMLEDPLRLFLGLGLFGFVYHTGGPEVGGVLWAFFYDMGIFGTVLLIFLLVNLYVTFKPYLLKVNYREMGYASVMLVAAILGYIADTGMRGLVAYDLTGPGSRLVWFPLGFIMAVLNIVKDKESERKTS